MLLQREGKIGLIAVLFVGVLLLGVAGAVVSHQASEVYVSGATGGQLSDFLSYNKGAGKVTISKAVGIGVANPGSSGLYVGDNLVVTGKGTFGVGTSEQLGIETISGTGYTRLTFGDLRFWDNQIAGGGDDVFTINDGNVRIGTLSSPGIFRIETKDVFSRLTFNELRLYENGVGDVIGINNGMVGIGTTNPQALLDVPGTARIAILNDQQGNNFFSNACAGPGLSIKTINADGSVTCEVDDSAIGSNPSSNWADIANKPEGFADNVDDDYCAGGICGALYADIYYDKNNDFYKVDPTGVTRLSTLAVGDNVAVSGSFTAQRAYINTPSGTNMYGLEVYVWSNPACNGGTNLGGNQGRYLCIKKTN